MNAKNTAKAITNSSFQVGMKVNARRSDLVEFICDDDGAKAEFVIVKFDKGWFTIEAENGLKMNARDKQLVLSEKQTKKAPAKKATAGAQKAPKKEKPVATGTEDEVSKALDGSNVNSLRKASAVRHLLTSIGCIDEDFSWEKFENIPADLATGLLRMRIGNLLRGAISKKAKRDGTYKGSEHLCTFNNGEAEISISTYEAQVLGNIVKSEYNDHGENAGANTWLPDAVKDLPVRSHSGVVVSMQRKGIVTVNQHGSKDGNKSSIHLTALGSRAYKATTKTVK